MSDEHVIYSDGHRVVRRSETREPTKGGAHAFYEVDPNVGEVHQLDFQYDAVSTIGAYGWTNEAILAVVKDRLEGFQAGPFPCQENEDALNAIRIALARLEQRTADRKARGAEGKHQA